MKRYIVILDRPRLCKEALLNTKVYEYFEDALEDAIIHSVEAPYGQLKMTWLPQENGRVDLVFTEPGRLLPEAVYEFIEV